jgi:SAM-dependent methyltransferase
MGHLHQLRFVTQYTASLDGPYLEAGAKDYGNTQDLRPLFAGRGPYVGVDMDPGPGVDVVLDLTDDFDRLDTELGGVRFGTIFCLSVLEHCRRPAVMAENLTRLLRPGGKLCVSAPFAFKIHAYPSDYWRFTPEGIRALFPELEFRDKDGVWVSTQSGDFRPLDEQLGKIPLATRPYWREGRFLRGLSAKLLRWFTGYRYVLAPTDIMMIGMRRPPPV